MAPLPSSILHGDFKPLPLWWEEAPPLPASEKPLPARAAVAIGGGGYAGLAAALALARHGLDAVVLDAALFGCGASARNAGFVGSYGNLSARYGGGASAGDAHALRARHAEAAASADLVERLCAEEKIDCRWQPTGHLIPAWSRRHYLAMASKVAHLNAYGPWDAALVPPDRVGEELAGTFYRGAMTIARTALIHPALYHHGLIAACARRGVVLCDGARVTKIARDGEGFRLRTTRGETAARHVIIATNGETGELTPQFRRRLISIGSYMIATEELPAGTVRQLIPRGRSVFDSKRVLSYCRPSPDGRRLLFGGRVRFTMAQPEEMALPLYRQMVARFPDIDGCRISHAWMGRVAFTFDEAPHMGMMDGLHYALGCNGSGIAMMTWLGTRLGEKIAGVAHGKSAFLDGDFPSRWYYSGDPWFVPIAGQYFRLRDWLDRRGG